METTELVTFEIQTEYFHRFEAEFARLAKKARKLGVQAPTFEMVGEKVIPARIENRVVDSGEDFNPFFGGGGYNYQTVSVPARVLKVVKVSGQAPKLAGWAFVAVLQHEPAGNLVHRVPGTDAVKVEINFRTASPYCGHCKTTRRRNDTFVVSHDDGRQLQVGRNCLADFTGCKSPEAIARWAELLGSFEESFRDGEPSEGGGGGGRDYHWGLDTFLAVTCAAIRENGWLSRTKAREWNKAATADYVLNFLNAKTKKQAAEFIKEVTEDDAKRAQADLAFAKEHFDQADESGAELGDYEHNLRLIAQGGSVSVRASGLAASLIAYAERLMGKAIERKLAQKSEFQGEVGKDGVWTLVVTRVISIEGPYGTSHLHLLQDRDGNRFTWKASRECLDVGNIYRIAGKVKEHKIYSPTPDPDAETDRRRNPPNISIKQTVLTRCDTEILTNGDDWTAADAQLPVVEARRAAAVVAAKAQAKVDAKARKALVKEGHKPTCTQVKYVGKGYSCSCGFEYVKLGHKPECMAVVYNNDQHCDCGIKAAADAKERESLLAEGHQPTCMVVTNLNRGWNCSCGLNPQPTT